MAMGSGKVFTPRFFGHAKQLLLNKFFDPSTSSIRKGDSGEKQKEKKRLMTIVATTSLPAVDRPNTDHWNAPRSCRCYKPNKDGYWVIGGHMGSL